MSAIGAVGSYGSSGVYWYGYNRAASVGGAVEAVTPVKPVTSLPASGVDAAAYVSAPASPAYTSRPESVQDMLQRYESDPVSMAVRQRIQYVGDAQAAQAAEAMPAAETMPGAEALPGAEAEGEVQESKSAAEVAEEGECKTCAERKYQDGSDDPGVSFKTPGHIDPDNAASVVRGHEQEHVVRERAKAAREDRKVIQQSVTLHTSICPDCGKVYVSGGTTRTTTAADLGEAAAEKQRAQRAERGTPFEAVA